MGTLTKHTCKIIPHLFIPAGCIAFLFLSGLVFSANSIPINEEINRLAEKTRTIGETFMQKSFELRMKYRFSGEFVKEDDKNRLHSLAKDAGDSLRVLAEQQQELKQKIEDYEGEDWDDRYGSTGLWRKLAKDLYATKLAKCEVDYYLALTSEQSQKNIILHKILREVDSLNQTYKQFGPQLVKGKALSLLAQMEPAYKKAAIKELDAFKVYSDVSRPIQAAIEKIKLVGSAEPNELGALIRCLEQNRCDGELELVLPLLFLQRRYDTIGFEKTVQAFPETEDFLGSLILSDISSRSAEDQYLEQLSVFEAELAALAAWKNEAKDHKALLELLMNTEKFQTPLVLYVTAAALAESSPAESVNLLIKAGRLQQLQKSDNLDVEAETIAEQAARLAYNLFAEGVLDCKSALEAFENYIETADNKIDENPEYLYTVVLNDCGDREKSKRLLEKIAGGSTVPLRDRAKLDLIIQQLVQNRHKNQDRHNESLEQLRDFISSCHNQGRKSSALCMEAVNIYCRTLLERKDESSAQKVLTIIDKAESITDIRLDLFRSKAFQRLGILDKAVHHMLLAIRDDSGSLSGQVNGLLSEVLETIEQLQLQVDDFDGMIKNCEILAEFSYKSLGDRKSTLYLAEFNIFAADKERDKLMSVEKLLSSIARNSEAEDVDLRRCRARLLTEQGEFEKAAELWAKICEMQRSEMSSENQRSWKWWRAKFYELYCCAKMPNKRRKEVLHAIEVLQNSFPNIPPLWAERLNLLKGEIE